MIVLYAFIDAQKHQYLLDNYSKICTEVFNTKLLRYKRWQDAQLSLLGRILLQYGLNNFFDIKNYEVDLTSDNKPFLKNQDIHFNISHSGNVVICGISRFPIGIDIEYINPKIEYTDFKSEMSSNEFNKIHLSKDKIKEFFIYWTEKEAIIKAQGKGLLIPLKSFEVFQNQTVINEQKFYLKEIFVHKEYQCYIASHIYIQYQNIQLEQINLDIL